MEIFLVGGAVRDELLDRPVFERDWVVVGATPEELIALNFQPVGRDFPVFLHPETHEEYALARTERKTSKGYKGFAFYATPDVTLVEDLKRRDLTINAMAKSKEGKIIDPYNGQADLKSHWLRHVSDAFAEDPVRILRIGRFASMLPDFNVHPDTNRLMHDMVKAGEVDALVAERVWKELSRALMTKAPERFFEVLEQCHALPILFPELVDNTPGITALKAAVSKQHNDLIRFAALLHNLEPKQVQSLCNRYRLPKEYTDLALLVSRYLKCYKNLNSSNAKDFLDLLRATDAFRRPQRFFDFLQTCALVPGGDGPSEALCKKVLTAAGDINTNDLVEKNLAGPEMAKAVYDLQLDAIHQVL